MAKKKIRKFSKTNRRRLLIVFLFVLVCFVCLIIRLVQINIADGDTYEKNVLTLLNYDGQTIPYKRGDITDRNGTVLATSEKIYNLVLDRMLLHKVLMRKPLSMLLRYWRNTFQLTGYGEENFGGTAKQPLCCSEEKDDL